MNPIDPTKTYRTSDGKSVRILATDLPGPWPVAILVSGDSLVTQLTAQGQKALHTNFTFDGPFIIEEKPRIKKDYWVNVYRDKSSYCYETKEAASKNTVPDPELFARVKITIDVEMGEGLE